MLENESEAGNLHCCSNKWTVKILDKNSAFLQGQPIERDVLLQPPKEAKRRSYGN